ncbi:transcriptional regulator [candidate division WOR-1 bacterium RIFCSPLOWO2_12_FULL_45_9]|uniref:Probable transcriptional regulatory protein A3F86_02150 n=1 Tax=candidate division WOR-1 bacterium RIFCSPLOWO2_12_FULL_45_9 TaxID=1802568 RepID=A0A1F4RKT0_UNCSA|nr:MAG: transcriptional regulator [candidate division WOR-1 bacterium RIFCSPLOWO2_12_FULL_45_9]
MSGHSKWATIKHKKAKTDAQRGKVFTKIIREITSAAKIGGGDPNGNPRLRLAIDKAKEANMPNDNIKRAIDKGIGGGDVAMEELLYEGYGPGGVALLIELMTDNRNRTAGDIRSILDKNGGNLGAAGSVSYLFSKKGIMVFDKQGIDEESLTMAAIDAGAEDISAEGDAIEVTTVPENFEAVRDALKKQGFAPQTAEVTMVSSTTVKLIGETAQQMIRLVSALEDHDDVQAVHANFDIADEEIESLS